MAWRYHVQVPPPVDRKLREKPLIYILRYQGGGIAWWEWVGVGGGGTTDAMMVIKELIGDTKLENENFIFSYL